MFVDGAPIRWEDLRVALVESSGGEILAEEVLDRLVRRRLEDRGLSLTMEWVEDEKQLLAASLDDDPDRAQQLLAELRQRRGLGAQRFARLLERNAGLRLLVQDEVEVSPAAIDQAYRYEYGRRYEARLIVAESLQAAVNLARRARAGESFIDLAIEHSVDSSRAQGGYLGAVSPVDSTYPKAIRDTLAGLEVGEVSDPVSLDSGFALLQLQRVVEPQAVEFETVRPELTQRVKRRVERMLMERLARTLLSEADVIVLDPTLGASWADHQRAIDRAGQ